jgi:cytochrome c oxidase assembly factor CtaG
VEWSRPRVASFVAGVVLVLAAVVGPLHDLQFDLLTAHLLQNVALAEWAPALLVFGLPPAVGERLARYAPMWVALPLWLVTYYVWHLPPVYDAALEHPATLLQLEHLSYLVAGAALWLPLAHGSGSSGAKAGYVFAAFVFVSPLGLLLLFLPSAAYDFYDGHWGLSALEDQQLAGITMVSESGLVFFAALAYYFAQFAREQS